MSGMQTSNLVSNRSKWTHEPFGADPSVYTSVQQSIAEKQNHVKTKSQLAISSERWGQETWNFV